MPGAVRKPHLPGLGGWYEIPCKSRLEILADETLEVSRRTESEAEAESETLLRRGWKLLRQRGNRLGLRIEMLKERR